MTARDEAIAARAEFAFDGADWGAASEHLRADYRGSAAAALNAALPVLLDDLADRIDAFGSDELHTWGWNDATRNAAEVVRAAAEGWGA